jgi:DNA-binding PadR family transcriptional regulator
MNSCPSHCKSLSSSSAKKGNQLEPPISSKAALLQALIKGEGWGADLIARVNRMTNGRIKLGAGAVYPALLSLSRHGLIKQFKKMQTASKGRPRVHYKITAKGRKKADSDQRAVCLLFDLDVA